MIRLGVVGTGIIWRKAHLPALRQLPEQFSVTALCARSEQSRAAAARECPGARVFADYRELIQSPGVDAVVAATPIPLNAPVSIAALEAGKDVFVEKPMAATADQARALLDAEQRSRRTVYVLEQVPYTAIWPQVRAVLDSGEIGRPVIFDRMHHSYIGSERDPDGYAKTAWRRQAEFPLGQMLDGGVHHIAAHALLFGEPESVFATGQALREEYGEYASVCMLFQYPRGVTGWFSHSSFLDCDRNYFHIRCTEGLIAVEPRRFSVERKFGEKRVMAPDPATFDDLHRIMWSEMADRAARGEPPRYTSRMAFRDIAALDAVERSIKSGAPARIEASR